MELIRLENLYKTYHLGEVDVPVLRGISLSVEQGEMVALMGASGSGKSTLMNILGCLDRPSSGHYWLAGQEMSGLSPNERALVRTERLGFVFQNFNLLARTSALQNVLMPLDYAPRRPGTVASRRFAYTLLERVGLSDRTDHEPSQMSGGQQQRVAIGRSLINRPSLLLADEPTGNLDSHTSVEILRMFQQLNAEGITVILVTHAPEVAAYTHRTIRIHDGQVASDERSTPSAGIYEHLGSNGHERQGDGQGGSDGNGSSVVPRIRTGGGAAPPAVVATCSEPVVVVAVAEHPAPSALADVVLHEGRPSLLPSSVRTAFGSLRRNKMRSGLTTLGIIIGIAAVIAMTEIGQGSKLSMQTTIASMGANNLSIQPGAAASGGINFGSGSVMSLTPQDCEQIRLQCPAVSDVAPIVRARPQLVYGNRNWIPVYVYGTTPSYLAVRDWEELADGEMFTDQDVVANSRVCVIGATIQRELFGEESPVGHEIRLQNVLFRVIGVLSRKGSNMVGMDQDDIVLAPWTTIKFRVSGSPVVNSAQTSAGAANTAVNTLNNLYPGATALYPAQSSVQAADTPQPIRRINVDNIMAKAASTEEIPQAMEQITELLRERHHCARGEEDDFDIRDMTEVTSAFSKTSAIMGGTLLFVALVSLVVGGVGIMNIMLVSVTERTREIGLRMAVGARSYHILRQFLVEAVVLCLVGGALGIGFGRLASMLVKALMHWPVVPSVPAIVAAVAVSATVGVVFGFYPAWKASRLDPIEALRYE